MPDQLKSRVLTVFQILWEQTDENHPTTIRSIQEQLQAIGINAGRKTIADDIISLREVGYDIICNKRQQNQYFIGSRNFELPELMMLINAVQAVKFIAPRKRRKLIKKLTAQASQYQAEELVQLAKTAPVKQDINQSIYYTIEDIRLGIAQQLKVTFQYMEYNTAKKRILKHGGHLYEFSPYDLMWNGDLYYVIGYSERHGKVATFRVDRITNLTLTDKFAEPYPKYYRVAEYRHRIFQMYEGETYKVTLRCDNSLMDAVIDRFGVDCNILCEDCDHFLVTEEMAISPTFFSWVFNFVGKIEILYPDEVISEYASCLKLALEKCMNKEV